MNLMDSSFLEGKLLELMLLVHNSILQYMQYNLKLRLLLRLIEQYRQGKELLEHLLIPEDSNNLLHIEILLLSKLCQYSIQQVLAYIKELKLHLVHRYMFLANMLRLMLLLLSNNIPLDIYKYFHLLLDQQESLQDINNQLDKC